MITICRFMYKLFSLVFFITTSAVMANEIPQKISKPMLVKTCEPCDLLVSPALSEFSIRFEYRNEADNFRSVQALLVSEAGEDIVKQRLIVETMTPVAEDGQFFFGGLDINFDGYNDIVFAPQRGIVNTFVDYWLFDPINKEFYRLGNYPIFSIDKNQKRLKTYERGGYGGMIYESNEYVFVKRELIKVRTEKQEATSELGVFKRITKENIDGAMKIIKTEMIQER